MSAESLIELAESKGLLEPKTIVKLRKQVEGASKPVTPEKLVKALIKAGKLTKAQGKMLLDDVAAAAAAKIKESSSDISLAAGSTPALIPVEPEPLEELTDESLEELEPLDGSGGLTPLDEAEPLDDPLADGLTSLDDLDGGLDDELDGTAGATAGRAVAKKKKGIFGGLFNQGAPRVRKNRWDSPLLLLGGGGLILLLLAGVLLYFLIFRGSGDEVFELADQEYQSQSYSQAIYKYQQFIDGYPKHPKVSLGKCRISLAKMRQLVETPDWERALTTSTEELKLMEPEEAFDEVRPELAGILPEIYNGFVEDAKEAETTEEKQSLLDQATLSLALIDNPTYLPTSQRKPLQPRIEAIAKDVTLIERDINRDKELTAAVDKINAAAEAGSTAEAYAVRKELLSRYPGLNANPNLQGAVLKITAAEVGKVQAISAPMKSLSTDYPIGASKVVVLADRVQTQAAALADEVLFVAAQGAVYGVKGETGEALWRRWVGFESRIDPIPLNSEPGSDCLVIDQRRNELMRLNATTGKLVWRLPLKESVSTPVITRNGILVSTDSGKLLFIDPETGQSPKHIQMPQKLASPPTYDARRKVIYQAGEHSSLYVCRGDTLECTEVYYVGHKPGTVTIPPLVSSGFIFMVESGGPDYSILHVLASDAEGKNLVPAIETVRLDGSVSRPLLATGNRVAIVTDRGAVYVYTADPTTQDEPVRMIAKTLRTTEVPKSHFSNVNRSQIFVGADNLIQFELQASRGELIRKWVDADDDVYVGPIYFKNNVLVTQKRLAGSYATTVSALKVSARTSAQQPPEPLWSINLGTPPAGRPVPSATGIVALSSNGTVWQVGRSAIAAGRLDKVVKAVGSDLSPPFANARTLNNGTIVLPPTDGKPGLHQLGKDGKLRYVKLRISNPKLATPTLPIGDRLVACTTDGPVYLLDANGKADVLPYQPDLQPGKLVEWIAPAASGDSIIVADKSGKVHRLSVVAKPKPHLKSAATHSISSGLTGEVAALGQAVFAVSRSTGPGNDTLFVLKVSDLSEAAKLPIEGRVIWGPRNMGNYVLVATDAGGLQAFGANGAVAWSATSPGKLAGAPLSLGGLLYCTTENGKVFRVSEQNGKSQPWGNKPFLDLGEPLGAGATPFGGKFLMLLGRDSTLHVAKIP